MKALVTGGGGFLGGAVVRLLAAARRRRPLVHPLAPTRGSTSSASSSRSATSRTSSAVEQAVAGCDVVVPRRRARPACGAATADFYATNVTGTENVIAACQKHGVRKLVYTSTPSVVHAGGDIENGNESLPYPKHFDAYYPETKAIAEKAVLAANGPDLATVALRPHLIFGPGDPHLIPRIVAKAREGKLRRIGSRPIKVDVTVHRQRGRRAPQRRRPARRRRGLSPERRTSSRTASRWSCGRSSTASWPRPACRR